MFTSTTHHNDSGDVTDIAAYQKMTSNRFGAFSAPRMVPTLAPVDSTAGLVTLSFECWKGVVGNIVGKSWGHVNVLRQRFQEAFPGLDFEAKYNGEQFEVTVVALPHAIAYINNTLGAEIAMANEGIQTDPEFVGAVIGKRGAGLRRIERAAPASCTVYHEEDAFYVKFPADTEISVRVSCMQYVRSAILKRSGWLSERLSETSSASETSSSASFSTASTISESIPATSEAGSDISELSAFFSDMSPTPSEAFGGKVGQ